MDVEKQADRSYLILASVAASLGGLLFGYDTAVISGAVGFLQKHFALSAGLTGWAASSALIGCMAGAMSAGPLSDRFGRKPVLIVCSLLFAASGLLTALASSLGAFASMRFLGGFAIGAVSVVSPLYIAEVAPEKARGQLVSCYQLAIVSGILIVFFVNLLIQKQGSELWNETWGWRWMFGSLALPASIFAGLALIIPESPRWLLKSGNANAARMILERIGGSKGAEKEIRAIENALSEETGGLKDLFQPGFRKALFIGTVLALICQFSGINAIMYYAVEIFKSSGAGRNASFVETIDVGIVNFVFTIVALWLIDRLGRRPLLMAGSAAQAVSLLAVGAAFAKGGSGAMLLAPMLIFIAAFAVGMGPVPWVVISEIFPARIRGAAVSIATLVLWAADFLVSQTFPVLNSRFGHASTFWIYALCSLLGLIFVWFAIPETKGRSLEDIQSSWAAGGRKS